MRVKEERTRNVIKVNQEIRNTLIREFEKTDMTIYNALHDKTKSDLAKSIRQRAKELLKKEIKDLEI